MKHVLPAGLRRLTRSLPHLFLGVVIVGSSAASCPQSKQTNGVHYSGGQNSSPANSPVGPAYYQSDDNPFHAD